jgi:hypothetical protein
MMVAALRLIITDVYFASTSLVDYQGIVVVHGNVGSVVLCLRFQS